MDLKAVLERLYPYIVGSAAGVVAVIYSDRGIVAAAAAGVDVRQLASAALNIFGLLTGLLFSIYVLAIAPGGGFIEKIFHTNTFVVFRRYVVEALLLGAAATLAVVPLMATEVTVSVGVWAAWYLSLTVALGAAALASFFRVAHVFLIWVGITARSRRPGSSSGWR